MRNKSGLQIADTGYVRRKATRHNHTRRRLLKSLSALAAACGTTPLLANASSATNNYARPAGVTDTPDLSDAVEFRFIDSKSIAGLTALGQGTLINRSASEILVTDIAPTILVTNNGRYHVSAYLAEHPIRLASGQQHHFWVRPLEFAETYSGKQKQHDMHGSLHPTHAQRAAVLARIDNPSIGVAADKRVVEFTITTELT